MIHPLLERVAVIKLFALQKRWQAGQVHHTQRHAGAFKNVVIAATAFMHLALATAHVDQCDHWQQGKQQPQQAFADQSGQQLGHDFIGIEQAAQLPVTVAQRGEQHGVGLVLRAEGSRRGHRSCAVAQHGVGLGVFDPPLWAVGKGVLTRQVVQQVRAHAQQPVTLRVVAQFVQQQVRRASIAAIAEVVAVSAFACAAVFDPVTQVGRVRADTAAVDQHFAIWVEQGHALQRRQ